MQFVPTQGLANPCGPSRNQVVGPMAFGPSDASRLRLIGQPERGAFIRNPKTNSDMKSVDLACNLIGSCNQNRADVQSEKDVVWLSSCSE
jgi:hypothetical protein